MRIGVRAAMPIETMCWALLWRGACLHIGCFKYSSRLNDRQSAFDITRQLAFLAKHSKLSGANGLSKSEKCGENFDAAAVVGEHALDGDEAALKRRVIIKDAHAPLRGEHTVAAIGSCTGSFLLVFRAFCS